MITSPSRLRSASGRSRTAFTLIELLTVIAIIGILAAIIIPTVSSVREKAKSIQCGVRVRQWGMAVTLYANDHKGYYDIVDTAGVLWCQISQTGSGGLYMPYLSGSASKNYAEWQECPSAQGKEEYDTARAGGTNTPSYTAYVLAAPHINGVTIKTIGGNRNISVPLQKAASPARTILLIERPYVSGGSGENTGANATLDKSQNLLGVFTNFTRHNKNAQTVFMDGHVKALKVSDMVVGSGRTSGFDTTLLQLY